MILHITKEEMEERKISDSHSVFNMLKKELSKDVSLSIAVAKNHSEITRNMRSDRIYYVLEGKLNVIVGTESYTAKPGDLIFISKRTPYNFSGTFKAVLVNVPAFDPRSEKIIRLLSG